MVAASACRGSDFRLFQVSKMCATERGKDAAGLDGILDRECHVTELRPTGVFGLEPTREVDPLVLIRYTRSIWVQRSCEGLRRRRRWGQAWDHCLAPTPARAERPDWQRRRRPDPALRRRCRTSATALMPAQPP